MTEQQAASLHQINEQLKRELLKQDPEVQVKIKRASLGWLYLQIISSLFAGKEADERVHQINAILEPLRLNLNAYPFMDFKLQAPEEAEAVDEETPPAIEIPLWSEILMSPEPDNPAPPDEGTTKRPLVVTFYSFKGGVGRSTALAFVANILAMRGHRVVMMDFDIEAPGLSFMSPSDTSGRATYGVLDYLHQRYLTPDENMPAIAECIERIEIPTRGELYRVPAGEYDEGYIHRLADLDIRLLYQREKNPIHQLLDDVKTYLDPDVILIDARTGFTEIGAIALFDMADLGIICFSPTDQSFAGLQWVTKAASKQRSYRGLPDLRFLLTPMPAVAASQQQLWVTHTASWIADNWEIPTSVVVEDLYYQIPYNPNITTLTNLFNEMPPGILEPYIPLADSISANLPEENPVIPELADQRNTILSELAFETRPTEELEVSTITRIFQQTGDSSRFSQNRIQFIRGAQGSGKTMLFRLFVERPKEARELSRLHYLPGNVLFVPGHGPAYLRNTLLTSTTLSNYELSSMMGWWRFWESYTLLQLVAALPESQTLPDLDQQLVALAQQEKREQANILAWLASQSENQYKSFNAIDGWLEAHQSRVWLLFDELDVLFNEKGKRRQALEGLIGWWLEMGPTYRNIVSKIFLREDIWNELEITYRSSAPTRSIQLGWEDEDLWRLVLRHALTTSSTLTGLAGEQLGISLTGLNNIGKEQLQKSLYALWGERMESGNKAYTHSWVSNRISDSQNDRFPRSLLQLLKRAVDIEKASTEQVSPNVILRSKALIEALPFVSEQRVAEIYHTYPEFVAPLEKLRGESSPIGLDRLSNIWQKHEDELNSLVTDMIHAGILQEYPGSPDSNTPRYTVAELYLYGLGMKRQGQR